MHNFNRVGAAEHVSSYLSEQKMESALAAVQRQCQHTNTRAGYSLLLKVAPLID